MLIMKDSKCTWKIYLKIESKNRISLLHCWWECKLVQHYGKQCGDFLKNWK